MQAARILTVSGTILNGFSLISAVFGLKCTTLLSSWRKRAFVSISSWNFSTFLLFLRFTWPLGYWEQARFAFFPRSQLLLPKFLPTFIHFYRAKRGDSLKWEVFSTTESASTSAGSAPARFYSGLPHSLPNCDSFPGRYTFSIWIRVG